MSSLLTPFWGAVVIRVATARDALALERLAELECARPPGGDALLAELRGELVAALPLDGGAPMANPFVPTADVVELLRVRARQLRPPRPARRRRILGRG